MGLSVSLIEGFNIVFYNIIQGCSQLFDLLKAWLTFFSMYPENCKHD